MVHVFPEEPIFRSRPTESEKLLNFLDAADNQDSKTPIALICFQALRATLLAALFRHWQILAQSFVLFVPKKRSPLRGIEIFEEA